MDMMNYIQIMFALHFKSKHLGKVRKSFWAKSRTDWAL